MYGVVSVWMYDHFQRSPAVGVHLSIPVFWVVSLSQDPLDCPTRYFIDSLTLLLNPCSLHIVPLHFLKNSLYPCLEHIVLLCLYWSLSVIGLPTEPCPLCLSPHLTLLFPCGLLFCPEGWGNRFLRKGFKFVPDHMVLHPGRQHSSFLIVTCNWERERKKNSMALIRERTIPTERPPPVGEVSANFCG